MSWVVKAVARENEILRIIEFLSRSRTDLVLAGGYAVSAMGRHRFSVDCDIVIPRSSLPKLERLLSGEGYKKDVERRGFDAVYGGEFVSFSKKVGDFPVAVDLLVGSLACRQTGAVWSHSYVKESSSRGVVAGIERVTETQVLQKELLVAFKIHSGRETDLTDIVVFSNELDFDEVRRHTRRGDGSKLHTQIGRELNLLADSRFTPSLKGAFTIRRDISKDITRTKAFLKKLKSQ